MIPAAEELPDTRLLRCHQCSQKLGYAAEAMEFVMKFRPAAFGRIPKGHHSEIRKRCAKCCWINVFHPLTARGLRHNVETKQKTHSGHLTANHRETRAGWPLALVEHSEPAPTEAMAR